MAALAGVQEALSLKVVAKVDIMSSVMERVHEGVSEVKVKVA